MCRAEAHQAEDLFERAFAIDANNPEALYRYAQALSLMGRVGESLQTYQRLLAIEPLVPIYRFQTANSLSQNGRYQAAIAMLDATTDDSPARYYRNSYRATLYAAVGRYADAADALRSIRTEPQVDPESLEVAARLIRSPAPAESPASLPAFGDLSFVYLYVGAADRRLETNERNQQLGNEGTFQSIWSPRDAEMRKTERFKALMRKAGLVDYWRERGWPDLCAPLSDADFICD